MCAGIRYKCLGLLGLGLCFYFGLTLLVHCRPCIRTVSGTLTVEQWSDIAGSANVNITPKDKSDCEFSDSGDELIGNIELEKFVVNNNDTDIDIVLPEDRYDAISSDEESVVVPLELDPIQQAENSDEDHIDSDNDELETILQLLDTEKLPNFQWSKSCDAASSSIPEFMPKTVQEIQEIQSKDRIEDLWSNKPKWFMVQSSGISKVFPRDRYSQIIRYLHYCDEEAALPRSDSNFDKLYKIQSLLDHLKRQFLAHYTPKQELR